jgi:uncharacterized protein
MNTLDIERALLPFAQKRMQANPGLVLLGPRQVGKTTLARAIAKSTPNSQFLDMQLPADRAKLTNADVFWSEHRDQLVVLDEVQFMPDIFVQLRPEIDAYRKSGRFLLLGSASGKLLAQSAESLAGRVAYLQLSPFLASEVARDTGTKSPTCDLSKLQNLWLRGGFPRSFTASDIEESYLWRDDFITNFLARDLKEFGVRVPFDNLHRFWRMLAHLQGQQFNSAAIAASMGGLSHNTVASYLDILVDTMMVRKLEPHFVNIGKRLIKSPKVYVRDSGLLHALLGIRDLSYLMGHPSASASWEGFCIEQICNQLPVGAVVSYYRTAAGTELDLIVETGGKKIAFEIKFASNPKVTKGFWQGLEDVKADKAYIVAPVKEAWKFSDNVWVIPPLVHDDLWV